MIRSAPFAAALLLAAPAHAQSAADAPVPPPADAPRGSVLDGDNVTIGLGAALLPSYEGSDTSIVTVAPLLRGQYKGFNFASRGPGIGVDLIREAPGAKVNVQLGPVLTLNLDRTSRIKDPVVRALGEKKAALQAGAFGGVSYNGLLNPYDTIGAQVEVVRDVGDVHNGTLITPSFSYATPLSTGIYVILGLSATHISDNYARTYFSVTPAGSVASGLPVFNARGGWKDAGGSLSAAYDFSGDLRDGGLGCSRAAATPGCRRTRRDPPSCRSGATATSCWRRWASPTPSDGHHAASHGDGRRRAGGAGADRRAHAPPRSGRAAHRDGGGGRRLRRHHGA